MSEIIKILRKDKKYTVPDRVYKLNAKWKDATQLRQKDRPGSYVNQGHASTTETGEVLYSEGFGCCSALLVQNSASKDIAYLAHISDWSLSENQYSELSNIPHGRYSVRLVVGNNSRVTGKTLYNREVSDFIRKLEKQTQEKTDVLDDITIESGKHHWSMSYDPQQETIKVYCRNDNRVREYKNK